MHGIIYTSLLSLFFAMPPFLFAQENSGWVQQSSGTSNALLSVFFTNADTGWAVGNSGTVLKTVNGGENWIRQNSRTTNQLFSVHFSNSQRGWLVGDYGTYRFTTNGGATWNSKSFTENRLRDIFFINDSIGWTGSPYSSPSIYKTTNGGLTWFAPDSSDHNAQNIQFYDENLGWIVGQGNIEKTTDGGITWTLNTSSTWAHHFYFANATHGWIVGTDSPLRTTDGGETWTNFGNIFGNSVMFADTLTGWVADIGIMKTEDGGISWISQEVPTNTMLMSIYFVDAQTGWAVGANGTILKTMTGGVASAVQKKKSERPNHFQLLQNYPNPFNPSTTIRFDLAKSENVQLKIFNIHGREIQTLVDDVLAAGKHAIQWHADNLPTGIYLAKLQTESQIEIIKLVYQK